MNEEVLKLIEEHKNSSYSDVVAYYNKVVDTLNTNQKLYDEDTQVIDDTIYDQLYSVAQQLEKTSVKNAIRKDSPTQDVHGELKEGLAKVKHIHPMLSLSKAQAGDDDTLWNFLNKWEPLDSSDPTPYKTDKFILEHKEDGLTLVGYYLDRSVRYVTRGRGGLVGEDVTSSAMRLPSIANVKPMSDVIVRGEALEPDEDFQRLVDAGESITSQRNIASGSMRTTTDYAQASNRGVKFYAYNIENATNLGLETEEEMLAYLDDLGFVTSWHKSFANTTAGKQALVDYIKTFSPEERSAIGHQIDGLVIKANSLKARDAVGSTDHHPKNALAYKFESEAATTKLVSVDWQVGTKGQITPVGNVIPVELLQSTISRASLANVQNIKKRNIKIGDTVTLIRANDVIPQITASVETSADSQDIIAPTTCPSCGTKITVVDNKGKITLLCENSMCPAQLLGKLTTFVGQDALDIKGLSKQTLNVLLEAGLVTKFSDIYLLTNKQDELLNLEGFQQKKVDKLIKGIEESKGQTFDRVLVGLGVRGLGRDYSKVIAGLYPNWKVFKQAWDTDSQEVLDTIGAQSGVGTTMLEVLTSVMSDEYILGELDILNTFGVGNTSFAETTTVNNTHVSGKTFVITGKLQLFTRKGLTDTLKNSGAKVTGSVSKSTDYLVTDDINSGSTKAKKAVELGIPVIDEGTIKGWLA